MVATCNGRGRRLLLSLVALASAGMHAEAAPLIPHDDAVVLERVPSAAAARELAPLRRQVAANPDDAASVISLASGYLRIGRETADPRFISYAEAALEGWVRRPDPPAAILVLAATAQQSLHRFDAALALLERALQIDPANGQAWLTKATILQVRGEFDAARTACGQTVRTAGQLIAVTCVASVNSMTGRLAGSYAALRQAFVDDERLPLAVRTWILGQLGELAERLGEPVAAEEYFKTALALDPDDVYLQAAYADLLLTQSRYDAVLQLLRGQEALDNLLLRLAIAGQRFNSSEVSEWQRQFEARYLAARRDGDLTHLREQARFVLEVRQEPAEALRLAEQNWAVQREPADVRIYAAAIAANRDDAAAARLQEWLDQTGYEDPRIAPLIAAGGRRR